MAKSKEYPDLTFVQPRSWTNANRTSVQLIVIHDTEGSENAESAENGAAYDQRREDGTSTHYFHDPNSTVQCVYTEDIAHAARAQGNKRGIQHELCGKANQGAKGWADANSVGVIRQAAKQVARDCKKWGIPARKLTASQVADGTKGICGHADITKAFPQDKGTHTDPGPTFPWTTFIAQVKDEMNKLSTGGKPVSVQSDVVAALASTAGQDALGKQWARPLNSSGTTASLVLQHVENDVKPNIDDLVSAVNDLKATLATVTQTLADLVALLQTPAPGETAPTE